jgi:hypothetical protein
MNTAIPTRRSPMSRLLQAFRLRWQLMRIRDSFQAIQYLENEQDLIAEELRLHREHLNQQRAEFARLEQA